MTQQNRAQDLHIGTATLAIRFAGLPEGRHIVSSSRTDSGFRYAEEINLANVLRRSFVLDLDEQLTVRKLERHGSEFGQETSATVVYTGRRARGRATLASPQGPKAIVIDTTLPPGAFDGHALFPVLLREQWVVGSTRPVEIFDIDEQNITQQVLRVTAREVITVPAGEFAALKGELSTTQLPVTLWVTEAQPHRLLKIASSNGETVLLH